MVANGPTVFTNSLGWDDLHNRPIPAVDCKKVRYERASRMIERPLSNVVGMLLKTAADDGIGVDLIHDFPSADATVVGASILDARELESTNHRIGAPVFGHGPVFVQEEPFRRYLRLSIFYQPGVFGDVMMHVKPSSDAESPEFSPYAIAHRFRAIFNHYKTAERHSSSNHAV